MSASATSLSDLRQAFLRGDVTPAELREELQQLDADTDREELWLRWAGQGLFDEPIDQRGFTSFKGARVREVDPDE